VGLNGHDSCHGRGGACHSFARMSARTCNCKPQIGKLGVVSGCGVEWGEGTFVCPVVVQIKIRTFSRMVKFKTWITAYLSTGLSSRKSPTLLGPLDCEEEALTYFVYVETSTIPISDPQISRH
jgi:hypothetical protein